MPLPRRARIRDPEATAAALKTAARRLIAEVGYDGARTAAIAERAGVNKAMITYHFGGKRTLYSTILREDVARARAALAPVADSRAPAPERLAGLIGVMIGLVEATPSFAATIVRERMTGGRNLEPDVRRAVSGFLELLDDILAQGTADGAFRRVDADAILLSLVGSVLFFAVGRRDGGSGERRGSMSASGTSGSTYTARLIELYLRGLAP